VHSCVEMLEWTSMCPLKSVPLVVDLEISGSHESSPKWHLDRFCRFYTAHPFVQCIHTHWQTELCYLRHL